MPNTADAKRNQILEVAKRRFAHYGLAKTTMAEIARDLAFSKALLYYYFPDKNSLYIAVIESIIDEIDDELRKLAVSSMAVYDAVCALLEKRIEFIKRYFYIIEYTFMFRKEGANEVDKILLNSIEKQKEFLTTILSQGVERGELKKMDTAENANIFLNACMGMRLIVMKDIKSCFIPKKEDFEEILELQKKFVKIFIDGLRA